MNTTRPIFSILVFTVFSVSTASSVFAESSTQEACSEVMLKERGLLAQPTAEARVKVAEVEDLKIIFPHQERVFKQKNLEYLVVAAPPEKMNDPIYKRFQENSIELILSAGGGGFRHLLLRVGDKIYDFGSVQNARAGEPFKRPSEKPDYKGIVFMVGSQRIKDAQLALMSVYDGTNRYNNPPFSSVGGKLVIREENGQTRFESKEHVWIPGKKDVNIDQFRNNAPFKGRFIEEQLPDGRQKTFLENPYGVRIPVSLAENGERYVNGLSCASSAGFVLKSIFGIEVFDSTSAANLVKKLIEGNNDFKDTPDALVLYGPERKQPLIPLTIATEDRASIQSKIPEASKQEKSKQVVAAAATPTPTQLHRVPIAKKIFNFIFGRGSN